MLGRMPILEPRRALLSHRLKLGLAGAGVVALMAEPALWLLRTWTDPSYESHGAWVAALVAALLLRSVWSGGALPDPRARRLAWRLLVTTALIRLAGRLLAVKTLGALALVVDVAALGLLLGVARRPWALQPLALAAFSALALPVEHLLQRLAGHPLQLVAASLAERVLAPFFPNLARHGTLLAHPDIALAVDLPCSGARGLVLFSALGLALLCRRRAGSAGSIGLGLAVVGGAALANALRVIALFLAASLGSPVADGLWHEGLGLACLALGALPLLRVARRLPTREPHRSLRSAPLPRFASTPLGWPSALAVAVLGFGVSLAPEHPLDVTTASAGPDLPSVLGDFEGESVPLAEQERHYFARYGGGAHKRVYDDGTGRPHTALLVRTRSPLRHLHGPDRCLLGAGHRVTRVGVRMHPVPTVLYRSVAPDGSPWRVEASFVSDTGRLATGVSEVVWLWLEHPQETWQLVERISPWPVCELEPERCGRLDAALFASLDLPLDAPPDHPGVANTALPAAPITRQLAQEIRVHDPSPLHPHPSPD
jgi:exosortase/archaeosortase family protein